MHGDVVAAARVLYRLPCAARENALTHLIGMARKADSYRKRTGQSHAEWGDGSLMTAALAALPPPEPRLDDPDYCLCMAMVFGALARLPVPDKVSRARS